MSTTVPCNPTPELTLHPRLSAAVLKLDASQSDGGTTLSHRWIKFADDIIEPTVKFHGDFPMFDHAQLQRIDAEAGIEVRLNRTAHALQDD